RWCDAQIDAAGLRGSHGISLAAAACGSKFVPVRWHNKNTLRRSCESPPILANCGHDPACTPRNARSAFPEWLAPNFAPIAALLVASLACCVPKRLGGAIG